MITNYLTSRFKLGKLHSSWIIQTDDLQETLQLIKEFITNNILTNYHKLEDNPDYAIVQKQAKVKNINIDQLRELQQFLYETPVFSKYKVAIIHQSDLMNLNAANSCLKVLEDTPKNTYIFLITNRVGGILPTIRSRCNILNHYLHNNALQPMDYNKFIRLLTHSTPFEKKLSLMKELSEKNRELWIDCADSIMQLLVKFAKKAYNVDVDFDPIEAQIFAELRLKTPEYLIKKFAVIKKLVDNTITYDLDLRASLVTLLEEFKDTTRIPS